MKLIVGLGNPGREYHSTRHNVGFDTIDRLAGDFRIHVRSRRSHSLLGEGVIGGEKVVLAKPLTFMNLSGQAVGDMARYYHVAHQDIIVICDDVNLPLGKLRIRPKGSAGGHNGLKSVIQSLGADDFVRVRIGIGSPRNEMISHVLSRFAKAEQDTIRYAIARAADAVKEIVVEGTEQAMNRFNPDPKPGILDK